MAVIYENDCVCCDLPCIGCGLKRSPHYYCDQCEEETELFKFEGQQLCIECLTKRLVKVN